MPNENIKNVLINLKLLWFELQIKTQGIYHLPLLPTSQPSIRCCKIVVNEGLNKFMSFLQKNRTLIGMLLLLIDVHHFSKALFNFSYVPVVTLCRFSDES